MADDPPSPAPELPLLDGLALDDLIETQLADERHFGHPLRGTLARLWAQDRERLERIERIAAISDGYQKMAREATQSLTKRYDRQLDRLEKMMRISDGYQKMMRDLCAKLEELSTHDQLTGLANRRLMLDRLEEEAKRAARHDQPFALALADVDHFKRVNDRFGHSAGDTVLAAFAQALRGSLREYDLCARWGGEEFLMLLPDTQATTGGTVIHRVLERIRGLSVDVHDQTLSVTASIGMTVHRPGETIAETVSRADSALMDAKRNGRDCWIAR